MLRGLHKWILVISLAIVIGGHWAIVQSAAWAGMLVSFSQASTLSEALTKTFDGQNPCKLCKLVQAAKGAEQEQAALKFEAKQLEFTACASTRALFPPVREPFYFPFLISTGTPGFPPDLPPPIAA